MAANEVEVELKKVLKFLGAVVAALLALPGLMRAQAVKLTGDWLQLTPADPKTPIRAVRSSVTSDDSGTTVSIERRYRSRRDSVAGTLAYEASKKDKSLHVVVALDERRLWVVVGTDTVMEAPVAIGSGETLVFGEKVWQFDTPRGIRKVRGKDSDPHWI